MTSAVVEDRYTVLNVPDETVDAIVKYKDFRFVPTKILKVFDVVAIDICAGVSRKHVVNEFTFFRFKSFNDFYCVFFFTRSEKYDFTKRPHSLKKIDEERAMFDIEIES